MWVALLLRSGTMPESLVALDADDRQKGHSPLARPPAILGLAGATFKHYRLWIELPRQEELETLLRAVEALVENTNFDVESFLTPEPE